jgi:hypothetical protein
MSRHLLCLLSAGLLSAADLTVVDIQSVRAEGDPASFLRRVLIPEQPTEFACDLLVAGGGLSGVAAAIRAAERGHSVCLTEETDWIGGQMTAGGVSALDENRFIERSGATRTYADFRRRVRDYYRSRYRLSAAAALWENLNPGSCYVSPLCFEPRAGLAMLEEMLAPHRERVRLWLRTRVVALQVERGRILSALAYRFEQKDVIRLRARWVIDATELGDLLPLAGVPYVVGAEARADTGEPHAAETPNPACVQSFTYTFAIEHRPGETHRIDKPPDYEAHRDGQPFSLRLYYPVEFGWKGHVQYRMFGEDPPVPNNMSPGPFFPWRRLIAAKNFEDPRLAHDVALINWPTQDYRRRSVLEQPPLEQAEILQEAKRVSLSFLYWLQTEVARDDGQGSGYPELKLRADVMGTSDGLSKMPYFRESRRIRSRVRVVEQDIVADYRKGARARRFADSIGTAFYMVDIHPCGAGERARMMMPRPFEIPMGALIPEKVENLLAAGKNIGVTHITNGSYRLHPVEWNVGEAAATIAALELETGRMPEASAVQRELARAGVPLVWFDDLPLDDPSFPAIQFAAVRGWYPVSPWDLHAAPEAMVTRGEAAQALAAYSGVDLTEPARGRIDVPASHPHAGAIEAALRGGWMRVDHRNWFHPDIPFYLSDLDETRLPGRAPEWRLRRTGPVRRRELAEALTGFFSDR